MISYKKNNFLLLFLFLISINCFAQTYNFKNYNTKEGLPQSQVLAIYQDHKGYMWFGTNGGGVGKYNGNIFSAISENEGLANNVVYSIAENNKNELLFGTMKGLSVYNGLTFKTYNEKQGLKNSYIFKLQKDENKTWIGTMEGVYIFEDGQIQVFNMDSILNKSSVYSIFIDNNKNIWFGTIQNGVIFFDPKTKKIKHFNTSNGLMNDLIFSISQKNNGEILIGTSKGLNIINSQFKVREANEIPTNKNISYSCILENTNSEFYFGTQAEGLYKYNFKTNKSTARYYLSNGLTKNPIQCLFKDRENNLWIGTDGSGVYKYSNDKFVYYIKENGLPESYVNTVAQDKNGKYWIALRGNGLMKIDGNLMTNYKFIQNKANSIPDNDINAILSLHDGRIFFGTKQGLCSYENEEFKIIEDFKFKGKYILSLYEDRKKTIWIGTNEGLFKYINGSITEETQVNKLKPIGFEFAIYSIVEDKFGNIWIGTANELIKLEKNNVTIFNDKNNFINSTVLSATIDDNKNLWFGTGGGLFNYDYQTFTKISQKNGLSSNNVLSLQTDNKNRLIISLNTGIDILDLNDYYNHKISVQHLGTGDGLLNLESNYNASFKDKNGRILIGTIDGLEIYNPKYDKKNSKEAITNINAIKLFFGQEDVLKFSKGIDSTTLLPKNLILPFNKNHLTFQFIGVSLTAPEKVMYEYKLDGLDNDWTPPTSKTEATYSSLPPGTYKFMVKAMNNDGLWNKEPVIYEFVISPPWYKTWWFYTICVISLVSGIWIYNFMHTKKLMADKQKLEVQVTERTKELREEKEKVEIINKEVIEQKTVIEHHNMEIMDSIKYAKNIQEALLPSLSEINNLFKNSFVLYMPKDIVSGDFYWFAKNGDTRFIAAVDCTGHGVPGAFMSIVGNTLLNEIVNEKKITAPGDILLELHKGVKIALNQNTEEFERRDGMDITLCAFNTNSHEIQYAGANRPLWIYRKQKGYELEIIKATKFPIGGLELEENRVYQNHIITVNEGDCLYLFSDGYADQFGGPKGKKFMLTNLQKTLLANVQNSMDVQKQNLTNAFMAWKSDAEQIDDVLVIGIKI
jgi:ligand-binding sensor domain-containing protein/serine phosphatase RsbU (regulator of sigma subunit)